MVFDFIQPSMESVNPLACSSSDSFSDKNAVEEESPFIHPVNESSEHFSDYEGLVAPPVSVSPDSLYDVEVLENESDYTGDEEVEFSSDGSETADMNETEASVGNHKIPRKGKMVNCEDKNNGVRGIDTIVLGVEKKSTVKLQESRTHFSLGLRG